MPVDHYLVFYIPRESAREVVVMRVLYAARDIPKQLTINKES